MMYIVHMSTGSSQGSEKMGIINWKGLVPRSISHICAHFPFVELVISMGFVHLFLNILARGFSQHIRPGVSFIFPCPPYPYI